ncbi:ABC transporter permease [Microbispora sp. CA-135349]|uniref:ABC transporter permease n=1 Tax=Microbispora sp. CA-135349 TaxID=3239953 RepID=UPI003D92D662
MTGLVTGLAAEAPLTAGPGRRALGAARLLLSRPGLILSVVVVLLALTAAFLPGLFTSGDPLAAAPARSLLPPGPGHPFGTDQLGRDLFTRVVYGAGPSLKVTVVAVAAGVVLGGLLGLVAGLAVRWLDDVIARVIEVLLAVPSLLLSLTLVTALGSGTVNVALAVGLANVAGFARIMRAEVLRVRTSAYVEAAEAFGARRHSVLLRHVLPNAYGPLLAVATLSTGTAVLAVAALGFLGYGAAPPAPEWGALVAQGRDYLSSAWWLTTMPGLTVAAVALAVNRIARAEGEWAGLR